MSTTKHTPGPWRVESGPYYRAIRVDSEVIADMRQIGRSFNESNARLISAAPELLDALEILVDNPYRDGTESAEWLRLIGRAAIAKAKGES